MKKTNIRFPFKITYFLIFFSILIFALNCIKSSSITSPNYSFDEINHISLICDQWELVSTDQNTSVTLPLEIPANDGSITISRRLSASDCDKGILLFRNMHQNVTASIDQENFYQYGSPYMPRPTSIDSYCVIRIPSDSAGKTLSLTFSGLRNGLCRIPQIMEGSGSEVLVHLIKEDLLPFICFLTVVFFACALGGAALYSLYKGIHEPRIICLTFLMLCVAGAQATEMSLLSLLPVSTSLICFVDYNITMLLPAPVAYFSYFSCRSKKAPFMKVLASMVFLNIGLQDLLCYMGISSMYDMLPASYVILSMVILGGLFCLLRDYKYSPSRLGRLQVITFSLPPAIAVIALPLFWMLKKNFFNVLFHAGMTLFILLLVFDIIFTIIDSEYQNSLKLAELKVYQTLSTEDPLTGIGNRRAFDKHLEEINSKHLTDAVLMFLDLNGLKYTNDKFGHSRGDELILASVACIKEAYQPLGKFYRIGGDEFAVIIENPDLSDQEYFLLLDSRIRHFNQNRKNPLSLARGISHLYNTDGTRCTLSAWKSRADKAMYNDKTRNHYVHTRGDADDYREIIKCFVRTVDAKDSYTAKHSQRVSKMSVIICHMLGLSDETTEQISTAANLHDIGKVGVPDSILCKNGPLTNDEWELVKKHAAIGADIISCSKSFYEISIMVHHHHERYDGNGYPNGTIGTDIPLGSRIIAIADSIDAMITDRSYRKAYSLEHCRQEIEKNLGRMYDPAIGEIVLENWVLIKQFAAEESIIPAE